MADVDRGLRAIVQLLVVPVATATRPYDEEARLPDATVPSLPVDEVLDGEHVVGVVARVQGEVDHARLANELVQRYLCGVHYRVTTQYLVDGIVASGNRLVEHDMLRAVNVRAYVLRHGELAVKYEGRLVVARGLHLLCNVFVIMMTGRTHA